jgi:hypothetical protein
MARASGKTLALSHSLVFLAGFAAGKFLDSEELSQYRDMHESTTAKFRRRAGNVAIGVLSLGTMVYVFRVATGGIKTA